MLLVGFKPTIPEDERPQTYDLDRAATGTGKNIQLNILFSRKSVFHNKDFVYGILLQGEI
jgi:hypothetical protein